MHQHSFSMAGNSFAYLVDLTDFYEPHPFRTSDKPSPFPKKKWVPMQTQAGSDDEVNLEEEANQIRSELFLDDSDSMAQSKFQTIVEQSKIMTMPVLQEKMARVRQEQLLKQF